MSVFDIIKCQWECISLIEGKNFIMDVIYRINVIFSYEMRMHMWTMLATFLIVVILYPTERI